MDSLIYTHGALRVEVKVPWQEGSGIIPPPTIKFVFPARKDDNLGEEVEFRFNGRKLS